MLKYEIQEQILELVGTYRKFPTDSNDITGLITLRRVLAGLNVLLGDAVGKARREWKKAVIEGEIEKAQKQIFFYGKHSNMEKAKMYAKANIKEFYDRATKAEGDFNELDYLFRSLREVLSELNQRISYLRDEKKQEQFYNDQT